MRKLFCSALMIGCLLLTGCSSLDKRLDTACGRLVTAEAIALTAEVQADFGDTVEYYTLDYSRDGSQWTALVTAPESIAGVIARIASDCAEVEYDGAILTVGDLTGSGVAPIGAVPMVYETLCIGMKDSVWEEGTLLVGKFIYDDAISATIWFDETNTPVAAELTENGIVKAICRFENVQIKEAIYEPEDETNMGGNPSGELGA